MWKSAGDSGMNAIKIMIAAAICAALAMAQPVSGELRDGDILFQEFPSAQSAAIKIATGSEFTHCGIVFHDDSGKTVVWEAVNPVRITPLEEWIGRDADSFYVAMRLNGADTILTDSVIEEMERYGATLLGKPYDLYFNWDNERIYCSEYVWKIYHEALGIELSEPRPIKDYNLDHPIVQQKLRERYGENIPYDEPAVSPQDLFESELLTEVK